MGASRGRLLTSALRFFRYVDSCWGESFSLRGRRRYENLVSDFRGAWSDLRFDILDVNAKAPGIVYVHWSAMGTNTEGFLGLPPSNKTSSFSGVSILKVCHCR